MRTICIQNMKGERCIASVARVIQNTGFEPVDVTYGKASFRPLSPDASFTDMRSALEELGYQIMLEQDYLLVEAVKHHINHLIRSGDIEFLHINLSVYLERKLGRDYSTITHKFGAYEPMTIERYTIMKKLEYAKELLQRTELSVVQIAARLGYGSSAYFANQFRQFTDLTPTQYRQMGMASQVNLSSMVLRHVA